MDITLVSHLGSAGSTTDANSASMARGPQPVAKPLAADPGRVLVEKSVAVSAVEIAQAVQAIEAAELPVPMTVRSELDIDGGSQRVFARTVSRETGATVSQYPAEPLLRFFAKTRQQLDRLLETDA